MIRMYSWADCDIARTIRVDLGCRIAADKHGKVRKISTGR
jgi:hypothetical protein